MTVRRPKENLCCGGQDKFASLTQKVLEKARDLGSPLCVRIGFFAMEEDICECARRHHSPKPLAFVDRLRTESGRLKTFSLSH